MHDTQPNKFDDWDWHDGPAAEANQPREHAFTHIGLYLAWLIRHDMCDPRWFQRDRLEAVKAGTMTGSALADDIDGQLLSLLMTSEGAAFTAACYPQYMTGYNDLLGDDADYRLMESNELYARVAPMIDRLYAGWTAAS